MQNDKDLMRLDHAVEAFDRFRKKLEGIIARLVIHPLVLREVEEVKGFPASVRSVDDEGVYPLSPIICIR